jgi:hypothetical protein
MDVERASSRVKAGLGVIWKSVTETAGVDDASFDRYFRFDIVTLAHKVCPSSFAVEVELSIRAIVV